jgi:hypothetical protein
MTSRVGVTWLPQNSLVIWEDRLVTGSKPAGLAVGNTGGTLECSCKL